MSKKRQYFFMALLSSLVLFKGLLIFLETKYQLYLIGAYEDIPMYIDFLLIISVAFLLSSFRKKIIKMLFYIMTLLVARHIIADDFWGVEMREYYYSSPLQTNTLIIDEGAFLLGSMIDVYEKKNFVFKKKLPDIYISTDDGYTPFEHGNFSLYWVNEKEVDITYFTNLDSEEYKLKTVKVKFD